MTSSPSFLTISLRADPNTDEHVVSTRLRFPTGTTWEEREESQQVQVSPHRRESEVQEAAELGPSTIGELESHSLPSFFSSCLR